MGFFFQNYSVLNIICFIILISGLVFINEITRRNRILSYLFYIIVPILLVIAIKFKIVSSPSSATWFGVVKTFSALAGVLGFMAIRYSKKVGASKFASIFPVAILAINICEAIFRDLEVFNTYKVQVIDEAGVVMQGGVWNIMNAAAGLLLLLTLTGWVGIKVAKTKSEDMVWADQLWFWIIAYDTWNVAYCYNCISTRAMYAGVALIASCTIAEFFIKKGIWLQHRVQTLAIFGMFSLAFDYNSLSAFNINATYNPSAWTVLSAIALVTNLAVFVYEIYVIVKYKRNPLKEEMYTHLKAYKNNLTANNLD